jgi:hypothetical protein
MLDLRTRLSAILVFRTERRDPAIVGLGACLIANRTHSTIIERGQGASRAQSVGSTYDFARYASVAKLTVDGLPRLTSSAVAGDEFSRENFCSRRTLKPKKLGA